MTTTQAVPALEFRNVVKRFGTKTALDDVSLRIDKHEVIGLIGENGAGKSTLLKLISGIHQQDAGQFSVHGTPQKLRNAEHAASLGIGVVHQEQSLIGNLTVADNVTLGSEARKDSALGRLGLLNWRRLNAAASATLASIGIDIDPRTRISELSFAERQMIEIAKAVSVGSRATSPIVILDEPTSVLEPEEIEVLKAEMAKLKLLGSVVFVSHRLQEVLDLSDRIYVLRDGRIVAERRSDETEVLELFELMTGRAKTIERPPANSSVGRPKVLELREVTSPAGVLNVNLDVHEGQIHCLVGSTSSGAEQLGRICFGLDDRASGQISIGGETLTKVSPVTAIDAGLAYLPSERRLESMVAGMSVAENMSLTHPVARGGVIDARARSAAARQWIERLDIRPPSPAADITELSGGNQQKVVLAKWLAGADLKAIVLDHPMRGLDAGAIEHVKAAIRDAASRGIGVLMIADTLDEALEIGDVISVMKDGAVTASFDLSTQQPTQVDLLEKMV